MVSDFYPPVIGGLETPRAQSGHELARRGHDVSSVSLLQDGLRRFELDGPRSGPSRRGWNRALSRFYENPSFTVPRPGARPRCAWSLRTVLERESPDIVHYPFVDMYSLLALPRRRDAGFVHTAHDYSPVCSPDLPRRRQRLHRGRVSEMHPVCEHRNTAPVEVRAPDNRTAASARCMRGWTTSSR